MKRNPFYGKLFRSSSSRPFPRLCVPSVALNPISLTNADCIHHAFEEIGLIKKSFPFSEINFPKIIFFYELRQALPIQATLRAWKSTLLITSKKIKYFKVNDNHLKYF